MISQIYQAIEPFRIASAKQYHKAKLKVFGPKTIEESSVNKVAFYSMIGLTAVVALIPIYWMVVTGLMKSGAIYKFPPELFPSVGDFTLRHYRRVLFGSIPFPRYILNSLIVGGTTASITIVVASVGAYSLARLDFPGKSVFTRGVLVVYMFSGILLVVPLFQLMNIVGLVDSFVGLIIAYLVFTLPLALYLLGNFFRGLDQQIEEAAMIDGYSRLEIIFRVIMPMSKSALVAVFLFTFLIGWNEYLFATVMLQSTENFTLPLGIERFESEFSADAWPSIMVGATMASLPVFVLFLWLEKYMVEGLALE